MANVTDFIAKIKGAIYGKDVRESIADGIETINTEVESTTARQESLENTFEDLVINAGNSNAEIVVARKGEVDLATKIGKIDSSLSEIVQEQSTQNINIANKVDKTTGKGLSTNDYSDNEKTQVATNTTNIATHTSQITSLASGAPKAVSLVANMTDITKNYVYTGTESGYTAGNWYYYNGSTWASGGVYQSTGIADEAILTSKVKSGAIISEKTDFVTQSANLFDKSAITNNYYINNSGTITSSAILCYSDYISVKPGDLITVTMGLSSPGASYDQNKNRIGTPYTPVGEVIPYTFTVPSGVYYIRLNIYMDGSGKDINSFMVVKGNSLPSNYVGYEKYIPHLKITKENIQNYTVTNDKIANEAISPENMGGYNFENMFDKTTITVNKYVSNTGVLTNSTILSLSDFIPVVEGQTYTVTKGYSSQGGYYDSNKNWISAINGTEQNIWSFTIPVNCTFIRLNMMDTVIDSWMMIKGTTYPSGYSPYGATISWLNVKDESISYDKLNSDLKTKVDSLSSKWKEKIIVCFGDSITWYDGNNYNANTTEAGTIVKGYESYIREKLESTVINEGVSGNTTPQINTRIKAYDFNGIDIVTILAGTNDFRDMATEQIGTMQPIGGTFDNTTFIGAYQESVEYILNNYPSIKLILFTPIKGWTNSHGLMPETYPNVVLDIAKLYSLPCLDLYHLSGINDLTKRVLIVDSDTVSFDFHPSTLGYKKMADVIVPFLSNHYIN